MPNTNTTTSPNTTAPAASSIALVAHDPATEPESRAAADRIAAELAAMPDAGADQVNLDIPVAVTTALGSWKLLQDYLPQIEALPNTDVALIRKFRDYTRALQYWQGVAMDASTSSAEVPALVEKGIAVRDRVINDLTALAGHGHFDASLLANYGGTTAYRKVGLDLGRLTNLVHQHWATIGGKSLITLEAIDEAGRLGDEILQAIGDRDVTPAAAQTFASQQRAKAFTLFIRSYDEARRAMLFLRWHEGNVESIFPSLYGGRRIRSRANEASATEVASASSAAPATVAPSSDAPLAGDAGEAAHTSLLGAAAPGPFARG